MSLVSQVDEVTQRVTDLFALLGKAQLNWKPATDKWSIAQCLDHIVTTNTSYFPFFSAVVNKTYKSSLWEKISPFTRILGKTMVKTLGPVPYKKFKAPQIFEPSSSDLDENIVTRFTQQQEQLKMYIHDLEKMEPEKIIMRSPVTRVVTYSVQHAMHIVVGHEQRHVRQAENVLNQPNFPK